MDSVDSVTPDIQQQIDSLLDEAFELRNGNEADEALGKCDEVLALNPTLAEAHNLRGLLLEDKDDIEGAAAAFALAVEHDSEFEDAWLNLQDAQLSLQDKTHHLQSVPIGTHVRNLLTFGAVFFIAGCALYVIRSFIYSSQLASFSSPSVVVYLLELYFGNLHRPLIFSIFVTLGLYLIVSRFNVERKWAFALRGGIGCLLGSAVLGWLVSYAYYAVVGRPTLDGIGISLNTSRGPIGYTTASGILMGICAGFGLIHRSILTPLSLGMAGAIGFGLFEYLSGFDFQTADLLYRTLSGLGAVSYPDIITAANTTDGLIEGQVTYGVGIGLLTGIPGLVIGLLVSLALAYSVGRRKHQNMALG